MGRIFKHTVRSSSRTQMLDITDILQQTVEESGVQDGLCTIFVPHTTAALTLNDNSDPKVIRDMTSEINKIVPWEDNYSRVESNSAAHIKASFVGASETIMVEDGQLVLGENQALYFVEFDGPKTRKVYLKINED